ncbi:histidine triad nucleotide-binding protein [Candidatus Poribacteria bacterium]
MSECLFCKIASGEIPAKIVFEDEKVMAFEDINPQAPVHVVIIPKKHIPTILDLTGADQELVGYIHTVANQIAAEKSLAENGFRLVTNCKRSAGQTVFHLHTHLLGGRDFGWPPG